MKSLGRGPEARRRNEEKVEKIRPWIDPEAQTPVHFRDAQGLNAAVTGCNVELVNLSIETRVPYIAQRISVPFSRTDVSEDISHDTRDPDRPLTHRRLMLVVDDDRRPIIFSRRRERASTPL